MPGRPAQWRDHPSGYGRVTRVLHWTMAILFAWQFATAILHVIGEDSAAAKAIWWTHRPTGFLLFLLVLPRIGWAVASLRGRPRRSGPEDIAARLGHLSMLALMVAIPALALIRAHASGRGFSWFGIEIVAATGVEIAWLTALANSLHGSLGWLLLALILGHVAVALVHHFIVRDATLTRMLRGRA